jgi:hypothetical protein
MDDFERGLLLGAAAMQAGLLPSAIADITRRAKAAYGEGYLDQALARQWAEGRRQSAPHLFPTKGTPKAPVTAPSDAGASPEPTSGKLTHGQIEALNRIANPIERLAAARELEARMGQAAGR